jgi:hypothetical protein
MITGPQEVASPAPSKAQAWQPFAHCLTAVLAKLGEDQHLILEVENQHRFVQFSGSGTDGLRAESVSNAFLDEADQLTAAQVAALVAAGWRRPTHVPDAIEAEQDSDGSPNFFAHFDAPVPFAEVADFAARTLAEVFEVSHPDALEYDAFDANGNPLSFPDLCRRQAPRSPPADEPDSAQELLAALRHITGFDDLGFDDDGDICLGWDGQVIFVRRPGPAPFARIWAPLVRGLDQTPELLARLNALNTGPSLVRYSVYEDTVFADAEVPVEPIVARHVDRALRCFLEATANADATLQREFGSACIEVSPGEVLH